MKFLVIGASGFIGKHTLAYVESLGYMILGTQAQPRNSALITFDLSQHRIEDCVEASFFESGGPVYGIICAVIRDMDRCFLEREFTYKVNVENTIRLIEDLRALAAQPVYISSSYVFDGSAGYYDEQCPRHPVSEYGRHKAAVESYLERYVPDALVLRLDKIVGDDPLESHLFSEWFQWIREGRSIRCIKGQLLSPTSVRDVARAVVVSCQQGLSGLYNVANHEFFSRDELARQFIACLGKEALVTCSRQEDFHFLEPRPLKSYLDSTKFGKITGMRFTPMREVFRAFAQKVGGGNNGR